MANLETLELTISANAQSASRGLSELINSLSALNTKIQAAFQSMSQLNSEISKLGRSGSVKMPKVSSSTGASRAVSAAKSKITDAYGNPVDPNAMVGMPDGSMMTAQQWYDQTHAVNEATKATENYGKKTSDAFSKVGRIASTMLIRSALKSIIKGFKDAFESVYNFSKAMGGEFAQSIDKIKGLLKGAAINLTTAFAPAISALLPIVNAVAAAINYLAAAIQWLFSLLGMGSGLFGATAEQIDKFAGSSSGGSKAAKEMLASFDELNVISQESGGGGGGGGGAGALSGLIGEEMDAITVMAGEAMLALGLILAFTGHPLIGGALIALGVAGIVGPIATKWGDLSNQIKGEIVKIMAIAGASMLAIGMILTFTGANLPLGIGLIIAGIGNMVGAVSLSFSLEDEIKQQVASVTSIVSGALLAVGAIITFFSANKALGIGLMIAGAVGLASAVALTWGIEDQIDSIVTNIFGILSGALLAVGAIIAFSGANIPLGIGMMAAGAVGLTAVAGLSWGLEDELKSKIASIEAVIGGFALTLGAVIAFSGVNPALGIGLMAFGAINLVSAVALQWDSIKNDITHVITTIEEVVGGALLAVGAILAFSGVNIPLGIGLMAVGALSLGTGIAGDWSDELTGTIKSVVTEIGAVLGGALLVIGAILAFSGVNIPLGIGLMATGGLALGSAVAANWDTIVESVKSVATSIMTALTEAWEAISKAVSEAWDNVANWFDENIAKNVEAAWNTVSEFLSSVWTGISTAVTTAWNAVVNWWDNGIGKWISETWNSVSETLSGIWNSISSTISEAWENVVEWWNNGIGGWISDAWSSVSGILSAAFAPIASAVDWLAKIFGYNGESLSFDVFATIFQIDGGTSGGHGFASGGFPTEGQLFFARESGPELVGSIGNHTAVANNQQIVEGVANGVASANETQNALLREQNSLLRGILAKEGTVRIGASSQFGRIARQSLDMYDTMVGG